MRFQDHYEDILSVGYLGWWAVLRGATHLRVLIVVGTNVIAQTSYRLARLRQRDLRP